MASIARNAIRLPVTSNRHLGAPRLSAHSCLSTVRHERAAPPQAAMSIYEVHAASWRQHEDGSPLRYRELAAPLARHARAHGFTHIEFLPLAAHPLPASWGYQVTGHWAVDPRLGSPQDFSFLVEQLHAAGLGVLMDFVPGHFPKDDWALADFDGTPTYEYGDPREGEHRTWGTKVFNFRRPEVINFLTGAALYWLRTFGLDGLRIDAVSSMLYRNYDREDGEWIANPDGSSDNHDAIAFLKHFTGTVRAFDPHVMLIAEESTAWPAITTEAEHGGLGFHRKWNMGWMHDSLRYFGQDPVMRAGSHNDATFHQWYAYDEKWVLALSHDEVVHGKRSLLGRMPGDFASQLAHLRLLMGWQLAVPGVPLLFMGGEFGQGPEWDALSPYVGMKPTKISARLWRRFMAQRSIFIVNTAPYGKATTSGPVLRGSTTTMPLKASSHFYDKPPTKTWSQKKTAISASRTHNRRNTFTKTY